MRLSGGSDAKLQEHNSGRFEGTQYAISTLPLDASCARRTPPFIRESFTVKRNSATFVAILLGNELLHMILFVVLRNEEL